MAKFKKILRFGVKNAIELQNGHEIEMTDLISEDDKTPRVQEKVSPQLDTDLNKDREQR